MFFYITPKLHPPSIILINRRTNPKLIPNHWENLKKIWDCVSHHFLQLINHLIRKTFFTIFLSSWHILIRFLWNAGNEQWKSKSGFPPGGYDDCLTVQRFHPNTNSFNSFWITEGKQNINTFLWVPKSGLYKQPFSKLLKKDIHRNNLNFFNLDQNASYLWFLTDWAYKKLSGSPVRKACKSSQYMFSLRRSILKIFGQNFLLETKSK